MVSAGQRRVVQNVGSNPTFLNTFGLCEEPEAPINPAHPCLGVRQITSNVDPAGDVGNVISRQYRGVCFSSVVSLSNCRWQGGQ